MKNYLSGQITKDPHYVEKFNHFENLIPGPVNNPIHFKPFLGLKNWFGYMITCLIVLRRSEALYLIPDWKYSLGAKIEYRFAKLLGKPCYQINPTPVKKQGIRIEERGWHWALYKRNQFTGGYDLKEISIKFQKL